MWRETLYGHVTHVPYMVTWPMCHIWSRDPCAIYGHVTHVPYMGILAQRCQIVCKTRVAPTNESCYTYESCHMCAYMSHVTCVHIWVVSHVCICKSCHTYAYMSHVTRMHMWVMSHVCIYESCHVSACMSHVTYVYISAMSHIWKRDVAYTNIKESWQE